MSTLGAVVAWAAMASVVYVYLGYPLILWLVARWRNREVRKADITPTVSLVISAYNEEQSLTAKLENSVTLDYPRECLEIVVVSDASTDATDRIVESFGGRGVTLLRLPERRGKTSGLNVAVGTLRGEIVVFSDANIVYHPGAIRALVRSFADPAVGCVTGDSRYLGSEAIASHVLEDGYWQYERRIRVLESQIGSTVGGDGAIFAIRRTLYRPLSADAINDLVTPLQIVAAGHRAVFEPTAIGFEPSAGDFKREFRRKRRIVNRSWRGVTSMPGVLAPWRTGVFAWQLWSHKVLRWWVLPLLVLAGVGCVLAAPLGAIYRIGALGFLASLALATVGAMLGDHAGKWARLAHGLFYFYLVNVAAVLGIAKAMLGRVDVVWRSERA